MVRFWDADAARKRTASGRIDPAYCCAFSPDGSLLAAAGDSRIWLWDVATGREQRTLRDARQLFAASGEEWTDDGFTGQLSGCAFCPDRPLLATVGVNGWVRLWEIPGGLSRSWSSRRGLFSGGRQQVDRVVLVGHFGPVWDCMFSPDGALLATAGDDGTARLWNVATGRERASLAAHSGPLRGCVFSPDGALLATAGDDGVELWDVDRHRHRKRAIFGDHSAPVHDCAFSPDGALLATVDEDRILRVWEIANIVCRCAIRLGARPYRIIWNPGGPILSAATKAGVYMLRYSA
jgi:WD40 repeat protein